MAPNLLKFEVSSSNGTIRSAAARKIGMQSTGIGSSYAAIRPKKSDEYLCASIYTLQSHDNPPMIYTVNFLRDVASLALRAARIPATCDPPLQSRNGTQMTRVQREEKLEARLNEKRIAPVEGKKNASGMIPTPIRADVTFFVKKIAERFSYSFSLLN